MDQFFLATSRYNRQKYDSCIEICSQLLEKNPYDQATWLLKCKALTQKAFIDDLEIDEEGVADVLLDDNAINKAPRPGTSFSRPLTSGGQSGGISQMVRPMSSSGRPISGYMRPGTNRPITGASRGNLTTALAGVRPGTVRPVTSGGRLLRLGTASMLQQNGQFIQSDKLNPKSLAKKKHISKAIVDYLIYVECNFRRALDIASEATAVTNFQDWWWKARIGKCQFKMGMIKDAERQFISALKNQDMIILHLELVKVAIRQDQPLRAIELYEKALQIYPNETSLRVGIARIHDLLNDPGQAYTIYKKVLQYDNNNVEAIASIASYHFYTDQPEVAVRFYWRLVQCGINDCELWNNIGLCSFYASQYDMALNCFQRAIQLADDTNLSECYYNLGHVAVSIGDLQLAYQCFKVAVSSNPNHCESFNNLGVLELRKGNLEQAKSNFLQAAKISGFLFEPCYNSAYLMFKRGEFQESYNMVLKSLELFPEHQDSKELLKNLNKHFSIM